MTVEEIQNSPNRWLTPADVAEVLETDANTIRRQAQDDPSTRTNLTKDLNGVFSAGIIGCEHSIIGIFRSDSAH